MKKYYFLIIVALILGLVLTGCSLLSNVGQVPTTEQSGITYLTKGWQGDPDVFTLYAGQHIDVGTVTVLNDGDSLYVEYEITEDGWVLKETHLEVVTNPNEFHTNKAGNPKVGLFPHHREYDLVDGVKVDTYTILNPGSVGEILYIAAHAKVVRPIEGCYEPIWQIGDVESEPTAIPSTTLSDEFGGKNSNGSLYALGDIVDYFIPPNDFHLDYDGDMDAFPFAFAPLGWTHKIYGDVFTETVNIHYSEYMPFGGKLTWRWTAGRSGSETYDVSHDASLLQTYVDQGKHPEGFYEHSLTIPVASGNQMITFDHKLAGDGGRWDWIRLEKPCEQEETAWADGKRFTEKGNWATYFTYTVQIDGLVLWLDAGKGITEPVNGNPVSKWEDQSGNGNDAVQLTSSYQPTYITDELNGKPVVSFTGGTEQYLRHPSILTDDYTAFYVLKLTESEQKALYYYHAGAVSSKNLGFFAEYSIAGFGWGSISNHPTINDLRTSEEYPTGTDWRIHTHQPNALYKNGDVVNCVNVDDVYAYFGGLTDIGSRSDNVSLYFVGDIAEILVYDRILTFSEREMVETYLNEKYIIY